MLLICWLGGISILDYPNIVVGLFVVSTMILYRLLWILKMATETYKKFRPFWQTRLPFAFELLQHFLNDMQGLVRSIFIEGSADERQSKWETCESLFR